MTFRGIASLFTLIVFLSATTTRDLRAADASRSCQTGGHAVSRAELHQTVRTAHEQADRARKAVQDFLSRQDVKDLIHGIGMSPDQVSARAALLSDAEMLRLYQQTMSVALQEETAGLSKGAIWAIVIIGIIATILINWALWPD